MTLLGSTGAKNGSKALGTCPGLNPGAGSISKSQRQEVYMIIQMLSVFIIGVAVGVYIGGSNEMRRNLDDPNDGRWQRKKLVPKVQSLSRPAEPIETRGIWRRSFEVEI